jgi:hypothetical protein
MKHAIQAVLTWAMTDILHLFVCLFLVLCAVLYVLANTDSGPSPTDEARRRAEEQKAAVRRQVAYDLQEAERIARQHLAASQQSAADVAEAARRFTEMYVEAKRRGRHE